MRCNNCGWGNENDQLKCEKCNYPLDGSLNLNQMNSPSVDASNDFTNPLGKTISGKMPDISPWDGPNTGEITGNPIDNSSAPYQFSDEAKEQTPASEDHSEDARVSPPVQVPRIDASPPIAQKPIVNPFDRTIDPARIAKLNTSFSLKPLLREGEQEEKTLSFSEESVELSRENTDPSNMSITSKTQAIIENVDGVWYLVDKSKLKTTFKQANEPTPLKSGDVILMGDRKFIFEE